MHVRRKLAHAQAAAVESAAACGNTSAGGQWRRVEEEEIHEQITSVSARSGCHRGRWRESTGLIAAGRVGASAALAGTIEVGG